MHKIVVSLTAEGKWMVYNKTRASVCKKGLKFHLCTQKNIVEYNSQAKTSLRPEKDKNITYIPVWEQEGFLIWKKNP